MSRKILEHRTQVEGYTIPESASYSCYEDALASAQSAAKKQPGRKVTIFAEVATVIAKIGEPEVTKS